MSPAALVERVRALPPGTQDRGLGALLVAGLVVTQFTLGSARGPFIANLAAAAVLGAGLALRRRNALLGTLLFWPPALIKEAWLTPVTDGAAVILALAMLAFSVGRHEQTRRAIAGLASLEALVIAVSVVQHDVGSIVFPMVIFVLGPWLAGRIIRSRLLLAREIEERTSRLEAQRTRAAQRATLGERRRIARELHDVVAHSMSVMVIQAGAGRRVVDSDPERAAECAALIERVGRETLGEMRRLLGIIRPDGEEGSSREPQPGLDRLGDLVERARAAGLPVELRVEGERAALPSGIDLAAYRIVQEALTNALKHAGPAHAKVRVVYGANALELEISDDGGGPAAPAEAAGGGHGLVGMRERAALYGGEVTSGHRRGGGWLVHARLPLAAPVPA
jgi:signal transduction histidine kinase